MWFDSWTSLETIFIKGLLAYGFVVFILRITGKRTLSKMNAFDLIVTVALGSTLATVILSSDVTFTDGALALALLVFLQYIVTWLSIRAPLFQRLIKAEPRLLFHEGQFLDGAMRKERITREELLAAARSRGVATMTEVSAIVVETDGSLSVLKKSPGGDRSTLDTVVS